MRSLFGGKGTESVVEFVKSVIIGGGEEEKTGKFELFDFFVF